MDYTADKKDAVYQALARLGIPPRELAVKTLCSLYDLAYEAGAVGALPYRVEAHPAEHPVVTRETMLEELVSLLSVRRKDQDSVRIEVLRKALAGPLFEPVPTSGIGNRVGAGGLVGSFVSGVKDGNIPDIVSQTEEGTK